jgi:hypothetical protein
MAQGREEADASALHQRGLVRSDLFATPDESLNTFRQERATGISRSNDGHNVNQVDPLRVIRHIITPQVLRPQQL